MSCHLARSTEDNANDPWQGFHANIRLLVGLMPWFFHSRRYSGGIQISFMHLSQKKYYLQYVAEHIAAPRVDSFVLQRIRARYTFTGIFYDSSLCPFIWHDDGATAKLSSTFTARNECKSDLNERKTAYGASVCYLISGCRWQKKGKIMSEAADGICFKIYGGCREQRGNPQIFSQHA